MIPKEIICVSEDMLNSAQECSIFLNIPLNIEPSHNQYLVFENNAISIISKQRKQLVRFTHSFNANAIQRRLQTQDQHLLKAFKDKQKPIKDILDVTAGWCRDSFILAQNGYQVSAIEHTHLVYFLTQHSLTRYLEQHALTLHLQHDNALTYLSQLKTLPDAIYLDPMFPSSNHQAKNKKEIQFLQSVTNNLDIEPLFQLALESAQQRVVVKRPLHSDFLNLLKPNFQFKGKTIRFDVYQCF